MTGRLTVCVSGFWAGVDSAWEQDAKRLEATLREMLDVGAADRASERWASPASSERFVGWLFVLQYSTCC